MRDILITLIVMGVIPMALFRPHIGLLLWSWIGYMNPHRLSYGFAYSFPFAALGAGVTILAFLFSKEKKTFPVNSVTIVWGLLIFWMLVTTMTSLVPVNAWPEWERSMKIQLMILMTFLLINDRDKLIHLVWVVAFSIGFFGIKGGFFTIATAGSARIWGPSGSFIQGNNELALALIMIVPLIRFLQMYVTSKWLKMALLACIVLCALSILASYSRGAFLAIAAIGGFFWIKSNKKLLSGSLIIILAVGALSVMPTQWWDRMGTIETYQEDGSALGRINAWWFAFNLAVDRPLVGGGFRAFSLSLFPLYAPDPDDFHDAHSIYFEVLGEQGFVGLFLFLLMYFLAYRQGSKTIKLAKENPKIRWAGDLAAMLQVSLVGYAVGGAFLGLAYFDLPYQLVAMLVLTKVIAEKEVLKHSEKNDEKDKEVLLK